MFSFPCRTPLTDKPSDLCWPATGSTYMQWYLPMQGQGVLWCCGLIHQTIATWPSPRRRLSGLKRCSPVSLRSCLSTTYLAIVSRKSGAQQAFMLSGWQPWVWLQQKGPWTQKRVLLMWTKSMTFGQALSLWRAVLILTERKQGTCYPLASWNMDASLYRCRRWSMAMMLLSNN